MPKALCKDRLSVDVSIPRLPSNTLRAFLATSKTLKQTNKQTNLTQRPCRIPIRPSTYPNAHRIRSSSALHIQASASRSPRGTVEAWTGRGAPPEPTGQPIGNPPKEPTPIIPSTQGPEQFPHRSEFHCCIARRYCDIQCGANKVSDDLDGRCG